MGFGPVPMGSAASFGLRVWVAPPPLAAATRSVVSAAPPNPRQRLGFLVAARNVANYPCCGSEGIGSAWASESTTLVGRCLLRALGGLLSCCCSWGPFRGAGVALRGRTSLGVEASTLLVSAFCSGWARPPWEALIRASGSSSGDDRTGYGHVDQSRHRAGLKS